MNPEEKDSTYLDRLAAMKLLRENMFLSNPETYALTDIAEDLPGSLRGFGGAVKNVLPSNAIISKDPEERKKQIQEAIEKIKASRGSTGGSLGKEMLDSALTMAKGSVIPSAGFAALFHLLGPRGFKPSGMTAGYLKSQGKPIGWQSPITPFRNLKKLFTRKGQALKFLKNIGKDTGIGLTMSALTAAAVPFFAKATGVSDKALEDARKIMEEQPYITSLPSSEMLSIIKEKRDAMNSGPANTAKNIVLGAGLEAGTQAIGSSIPLVLGGLAGGAYNLLRGKNTPGGAGKLLRQIGRNAKNYAGFGAVMGGLGGALTKNFIEDKMDEIKAEKEQEKALNPDPITSPQLNASTPAGTYPT